MTIEAKLLLKYINQDNELNAFFKKLIQYCGTISSEFLEEADKPNLDKVKDAISKLESRGIMLSEKCKQVWLNEENYKNVDGYNRTLEIIEFSEGTLRRTDMFVLKRRIFNLENDERYATGITHSESEYKKWYDYNNYNLIKKRYEKENKNI